VLCKSSILLNDSFLIASRPSQQRTLVGRDLMPPLWHIAIGKCTTANGQLSWMVNSWKHTSTEWQFRVMIVSGIIFTLIYSHILQTTRRSKCKPPNPDSETLTPVIEYFWPASGTLVAVPVPSVLYRWIMCQTWECIKTWRSACPLHELMTRSGIAVSRPRVRSYM
jgi:hypothetical protein